MPISGVRFSAAAYVDDYNAMFHSSVISRIVVGE